MENAKEIIIAMACCILVMVIFIFKGMGLEFGISISAVSLATGAVTFMVLHIIKLGFKP